jgi:protein TonB
MKRLQENRIAQLAKYLQGSKLDPELFSEILDHLACEAEEKLWDGSSFEQAYTKILETADLQTLHHLSVDYQNLLAMEKSLDDIVFENRNKQYGAYMLRKSYGQTMQKSVLMGVTLFLLMVLLPNLYATLVPEKKPDDIAFEVEFKKVDIRPDKAPLPEPVKEETKPVEKMVKSVIPTVVPDEQVEVEYIPPVTEDLANARPADITQDGLVDVDIITAPSLTVSSSSGVAAEVAPEKEKEYIIVDQKPEYMGGNAAMGAFLQKHLRYPSEAIKAGVEGRVFLEFTVGSNGKIEQVKTIKGVGFGCDEEAERVVKLMPDWKPGKQAGTPVRVRFTLPISFKMN